MLIRFSFYLYFFVKEKIIESVSFCHAPESGKFHSSARQTVFAYVWCGLNLFADRFTRTSVLQLCPTFSFDI
nr:MAG TPA: hypothetical protein [Caudoviricetes sp.]